MKIFVLAVCIALATARPELGSGYRYSSPLLPISGNSGHGFSSGPCCQQLNLLKGGSGHGSGFIGGHGSSGFGSGLSAVVSSSYSASGAGGGGIIGGHGGAPAPTFIAAVTPAPVQGVGYSHGSGGFSGFSGQGGSAGFGGSFQGNSFQGGAIGGNFGQGFSGGSFVPSAGPGIGAPGLAPSLPAGGYVGGGFSGGNFGASGVETSASIGSASIPDNSGSTLVQKHIYVHVPPPDPEDQIHAARIQQQYIQPRKHYKIIFIKAPTVQAPSPAQIAAANALTEEKTLVYVLVKKPDEPSVQQLQSIQSTVHHHKPEVYFIKYKAKSQQQQLQGGGGIVGGGIVGGGFGDSGFSGGASLIQSGGGFAGGSGVTLTSHGGGEQYAVVTPAPTPYAPAGPQIIEPRVPEKVGIPAGTYGPPPEAVK